MTLCIFIVARSFTTKKHFIKWIFFWDFQWMPSLKRPLKCQLKIWIMTWDLQNKIATNWKKNRQALQNDSTTKGKICVCVSHPHFQWKWYEAHKWVDTAFQTSQHCEMRFWVSALEVEVLSHRDTQGFPKKYYKIGEEVEPTPLSSVSQLQQVSDVRSSTPTSAPRFSHRSIPQRKSILLVLDNFFLQILTTDS